METPLAPAPLNPPPFAAPLRRLQQVYRDTGTFAALSPQPRRRTTTGIPRPPPSLTAPPA